MDDSLWLAAAGSGGIRWAWPAWSAFGPCAGVEDGDRVKVVAPVGHFAVLDCDDGGEAVVVRPACQHRFTVYLVLEHGHRRFGVPVDAELVGGAHGHVVVVAAIQVNYGLPPFNAPGVAG